MRHENTKVIEKIGHNQGWLNVFFFGEKIEVSNTWKRNTIEAKQLA